MTLIKDLGGAYSIHYEDECLELRNTMSFGRNRELARIQNGGTIIFSGESACVEHMQELIDVWKEMNRLRMKEMNRLRMLNLEEFSDPVTGEVFYRRINNV